MGKLKKVLLMTIVASLVLSGCAMATVEALYCLPKRSEKYENVQAVIDKAMLGLTYCAPIYGDNRHFLQVADLDGDGVDEYLVFAKDSSDKPLKIMIFSQLASGCVLMDTIEGYGFGFDFVAYAQMDDKPGVELIVGRQLSDQVMRSVAVYRFSSGFARQLMSTGYNEIATTDMDQDGISELFLLTAGASEKSVGTARMYAYSDGELQRSEELQLSASINGYKLMNTGVLQDGSPAIYVTCSVDNQKLVTDIFTLGRNGLIDFIKGITVATLDNYFVYPEDIDGDGVLELPSLIQMKPMNDTDIPKTLVQWYSIDQRMQQHAKLYTYHDFARNWYMEIHENYVDGLSVNEIDGDSVFYYNGMQVLTILALTDADREEQSMLPGRVVLYSGESVIFVAVLEDAYMDTTIVQELQDRFHPIRVELNTEED